MSEPLRTRAGGGGGGGTRIGWEPLESIEKLRQSSLHHHIITLRFSISNRWLFRESLTKLIKDR